MHTSLQSIIVVCVFAVCYLYYTARQTAKKQLDIYDLFMLSMVAVIPLAFTLSPALAEYLAMLAGVAFPFVVMFGALFVILFIFIHRLTAKIHRLEADSRLLIQELSLLRMRESGHEKHIE